MTSNALDRGGWRVQPLACLELGALLRNVRLIRYEHPLRHMPQLAVVAEALTASVCHSTNWDRLRRHVLATLAADPPSVNDLAREGEEAFIDRFGAAFDAEDRGSLGRRYTLFADTAGAFADGRLNAAQLSSGAVRIGGTNGLIAQLRQVRAFGEDPHEKKSRVLVQQWARFGLITIVDPTALMPAIEYHLIRIYLRSGRVVPTTPSARRAVERAEVRRVDSLNALRAAVEEAMRVTADAAGLSILDVNDAEWQLARSYCTREAARCAGPPRPDKPCDDSLVGPLGACPFVDACAGANGQATASWTEPRLAARHSSYY